MYVVWGDEVLPLSATRRRHARWLLWLDRGRFIVWACTIPFRSLPRRRHSYIMLTAKQSGRVGPLAVRCFATRMICDTCPGPRPSATRRSSCRGAMIQCLADSHHIVARPVYAQHD